MACSLSMTLLPPDNSLEVILFYRVWVPTLIHLGLDSDIFLTMVVLRFRCLFRYWFWRHRLLVRLWIHGKFMLVADPRLHFIFSDFRLWSNPSGNPSIWTQVLMVDNSLAGGKAWVNWNVTPTGSYINDLDDLVILSGYGMLHLRELLPPDKAPSIGCGFGMLVVWRVLVNTTLNLLLCITNQFRS